MTIFVFIVRVMINDPENLTKMPRQLNSQIVSLCNVFITEAKLLCPCTYILAVP